MNNSFTGKVALMTGGPSGIGKATAVEFAQHGAKVVLSGRREKEGAQVVAEIKKLGGEAAFVRADVAKEADVKAMVKFVVDKFGRLDIAFNNAGVEWKARLIRQLKRNIDAFSTSTCGAFLVRCGTKFQRCSTPMPRNSRPARRW